MIKMLKILKIRNKKAMFFTILAIAMLSFFLVSYTLYSVVKERKSIQKRVSSMDSFLFSLEENLEREIYTFGFRDIFLAEEKIASTGSYIENFQNFTEEAFFNGTLDSQNSEILEGVNYNDLVERINEKAGKINAEVFLSEPEISVYQEDPWNIVFLVEFNISLRDKTGLASWDKRAQIKSFVEIQGFEDPVYLINTNGRVSNKINKTIFSEFVSGTDVSNLSLHSQNSYYTNSSLAPSFIDRIEGKMQASENGIESLVYLPKLSVQGITLKDKSCVDYIYFSQNTTQDSKIQGMPSWFKLDSEHLEIYQAGGLAQ